MRILAAVAMIASLAACGEAAPDPDPAPASTQTPAATASTTAPALDLQHMTYDEFSGLIEPGLGCSFQTGEDVLFVATAAMEPAEIAQGVAKLDGEPQVLTASEQGGYEALVDGATFASDSGLTLTVTRTSEEGTPGKIETTSWPAELLATAPGRADRRYIGGYSCGA